MGEEKSRIAVLWSGGLDSTVMVYLLASKNCCVKPYHILIRGGGGKDFREKYAIDEVWADMEQIYPGVEKPLHMRYAIKDCDRRNQEMISIVKSEFREKAIALGSYMEGSRFLQDNDKDYLSRATGGEVITFDTFNIKNKPEIVSLVPNLGLEEAVKKTWSCQLWFKNPCGKCFSCKQREQALSIIKK